MSAVTELFATGPGLPIPEWVQHASPGPGSPMTSKVECLAGPLRRAVSTLGEQLEIDTATFSDLYAPRISGLGYSIALEEVPHRAAWSLVAQWLVAYGTGALPAAATLREAEEWFLGDQDLPRIAPNDVTLMEQFQDVDRLVVLALLPYLLDPLAPATRRHVLKNGELALDRVVRKASGIYYTPADLADYMAVRTLRPGVRSCIDPACGTGVFLRAAARQLGRQGVLYGCDLDPLAAEMCAFVLLAVATVPESAAMAPWHRWHGQRLRLATLDSMLLRPGTELDEVQARARARELARAEEDLGRGEVVPPAAGGLASRYIGTLFPELLAGADALLCNPPYAPLSAHARRHEFGELYASFGRTPPSASTNFYVPFVELTWRLTNDGGRAAVVVPLSLAFGSGPHFRALRVAMMTRSARWRFSFFDRAPDALFGDDVKTRNAVVEYAAEQPAGVETTGLLRWTSRTRKSFFASIRHTDITGTSIEGGIPKVGSHAEADLYQRLRSLPGCLGIAATAIRTLPSKGAVKLPQERALHVAGTAYNWLSCARDLSPWAHGDDLSESPLTSFVFEGNDFADAAYAVCASRLTFWLWRVEGDAFHVSKRFLANLPFDLHRLSAEGLAALAGAGRELWQQVSAAPVISVNKGRRSIGFGSPWTETQLDAVDETLAHLLGLRPGENGFDLRAWYEELLIVDDSEAKRFTLVPRQGGSPGA